MTMQSLRNALIDAIECSGFSVSGPTDTRAAENGEPAWVCRAREALADQSYALMGRRFGVLATFDDSDIGVAGANAYIEAHPGAAVLAVSNGRVILADKSDRGVPVPARDL